MSLHNLATQMAAQGRGPDRTLVHMSPKEVQGLQALAMAHGGSLTINPETGLPEAGFLESILPAVAGFALNAFAPGSSSSLASAAPSSSKMYGSRNADGSGNSFLPRFSANSIPEIVYGSSPSFSRSMFYAPSTMEGVIGFPQWRR